MARYADDLNEYMSELEGVYRRAMETSLDGLLPQEAMLIKQFQMSAKVSKDKLKELQPEMMRCYETSDLQARLRMEEDLLRLRSELKQAWRELEIALQSR